MFASLWISVLLAVLCHPLAASAGTYSQVTNFGANSSGAKMFLYKPTNLKSNPAIIVAVHHCQGTAQSYYGSTPYAKLADQYGFLVIYPESPYSGTCWDVSSTASLTHEGGANSNSIANMVRYTISTYGADASRVFVQGGSSGAMMANVLAATYPDMFAAVIVYSGVPAGCFYTGTVNGWNSDCAQGKVSKSAQDWATQVRNMYKGYSGKYPRMQIYHGALDTTLRPNNYNETIKEWSGIFGYSSPTQVLPSTPRSGFTKYVYGPNLQGIWASNNGHDVPVFGDDDMKWYGIVGGSSTTTTAGPSTTAGTTPTPTSPPSGSGQVQWGQCGGTGWTGPTTCISPYKCTYSNEWYSQCV